MSSQNNNNQKETAQAIALNYDYVDAPSVIATGQNELAEEIIRLAKEHDIPIHHDPDLAVLLSQLDLHEHIPESLYYVVAEVLAFAYVAAGKTPENYKED
ncbi:MAG: EscU/YscU/HrcU family type III secretion system export apparatus switch protein [Gammaproteobacteria bacterium]|nr:EscU/YscU/HrcU family type III secretion system export apparatus switch protein [Gammaproteobacteria bacterium]